MQVEQKPKHTLALKPELRRELGTPLGTLIKGTPEETKEELRNLIQKEKPQCIISVGDIVSQTLLKLGIEPQIMIVDGKAMRKKIKILKTEKRRITTVRNPSGTLTPQTWSNIQNALALNQSSLIVVKGEEDLLTLVAVLKARENSLVVYGQPQEGVVVVKVNATARHKANLIVEAMETVPKS